MQKHKHIHIKVNNFNKINYTNEKKIIFSGKFCNTFLYEDEENFLKTRHLYKKINPKKIIKKFSNSYETNFTDKLGNTKKRNSGNITDNKIHHSVGRYNLNIADSKYSFKNSSYCSKKNIGKLSVDGNESLSVGISNLDKKYGLLTNLKYSHFFMLGSDIRGREVLSNNKSKIINNKFRIISKDSDDFVLKSFNKKDFYFDRK
jgi:hypothetical protein